MKKIFLVLMIALSAEFASAQMDVINLRDGTVIKCKIVSVDTVSKSITYMDKYLVKKTTIELSKVGSYELDGEVNKGMPQKTPVVAEKKTDVEIDLTNSSTGKAGLHLMKFADQAQTGILLTMAGSLVSILPYTMTNDNPEDYKKFEKKQRNVAIIGVGISLVGFVVYLTSFSQARKAGEIMRISDSFSFNVTDSGVGLAVPINYR